MISKQVFENLDILLQDVKNYILATYGEHYAEGGFQMIDVWQKNGTLTTTARDIAMKHLDRYGKKEGLNKKDLMKAIHFILMMVLEEHGAQGNPEKTLQVQASPAMEGVVNADLRQTDFGVYNKSDRRNK